MSVSSFSYASRDVRLAVSHNTFPRLISFAVRRYGPSSVVGIGFVKPYVILSSSQPILVISQSDGKSPSQSKPLGARTCDVWVGPRAIIVSSAFSRSTKTSTMCRFFSISWSIWAVSRSRNAAINFCVSSSGSATRMFFMSKKRVVHKSATMPWPQR